MKKPQIIVQKYGGSSVANVDKIKHVARLVVDKKKQGYALVVAISAMGNTTDDLLSLAKQVSKKPARRELDMLLSCGERMSMALLAMAISDLGEEVISLTGSQSGIITTDNHFNAKIIEVRPHRIEEALLLDKIVIVAGYQGMSLKREITTLGRGGTDTTAVALAAALSAQACEIYSDVPGVYSADPRIVQEAIILPHMTYEEMESFARAGAKVLNADAVLFAKQHGIKIYSGQTGRSSTDNPGTVITAHAEHPKNAYGVAILSQAAEINIQLAELNAFLEDLKTHQIATEHVLYATDNVHFILDKEKISSQELLFHIVQKHQATINDAALVSLVGEGIGHNPTYLQIMHQLKPHMKQPLYITPHTLSFTIHPQSAQSMCQKVHQIANSKL